MQSLWLPAWLYRLLPLIYLAGGAVMFHLFGDEDIGQFSAFMLWAAAILVVGLRLHARKKAYRRRP